MTTRCDPDRPCPILHRVDVSEAHTLISHALPPTLPIHDPAARPIPVPATVMLADPVAARFVPRTELDPPLSADTALVVLPCRSPAVIRTALVPPSPCPIWHRTDVSDSQPLLSQALQPVRPDADHPAPPIPAPATVMLTDPVAAWFAMCSPLACVESADMASVALPSRSPTVKAASLVPISPCPIWHRTDVSDSHTLLSHALSPIFKYGEMFIIPMLDPAKRTITDPVAATFIDCTDERSTLSYERTLVTLAASLHEPVNTPVLDP